MGNTNYANKGSVNNSIGNTGTIGDEVCNINDMASNCREWTTENSRFENRNGTFPCIHRGGRSRADHVSPAIRSNRQAGYQDSDTSFRVVIYVKL